MEKISSEENVFLGYIDEASVSSNEGKRFGRGFCGITPQSHTALSKIRMTIIACILPGFCAPYKKINNSVRGIDYPNFINEVTLFCRKYLCNNETLF